MTDKFVQFFDINVNLRNAFINALLKNIHNNFSSGCYVDVFLSGYADRLNIDRADVVSGLYTKEHLALWWM